MHDTLQLLRALKTDPHTKVFNTGVYAADRVPSRLPNNFIFIMNTDPSNRPGQHWVLVFRKDVSSPAVFFDSYGKRPSVYFKSWNRFDSFKRSKEDFQQRHSDVCGDHVLYVARRLAQGYDLFSVEIVQSEK